MSLTDRDVNTIGRSSRASNLSAASRPPARLLSPGSARPDTLTSAPGVMSMLKSSTELGTDSLTMPASRFSGASHLANRRSGTASRISTGSSHSQVSRPRSAHHSHNAWPSISSGGRRMSMISNFSNLNAPQRYLDALLPPSFSNMSDPSARPPPGAAFRDTSRSYSMTHHAPQPLGLANYRSLSGLRSQEPYPRARSPYRYPTRLKRPGYRPSSPALSDMAAGGPPRFHHARLGSGMRMLPGTYGGHGAYGSSIAPVPPMPAGFRPYNGPRNRSSPSVASFGLDHMPGTYPISRQGTPSIPEYGVPAVTPSNHNATDSPQDSSDPPSSSAPPTPRDAPGLSHTLPTIVPAPGSRRGSQSSTCIPVYYDYSEQFEPSNMAMYEASPDLPKHGHPFGYVHRLSGILDEHRYETPGTDSHEAGVERLLRARRAEPKDGQESAAPVMKRITRELVRSNLQPLSSDSQSTETPNITNTLKRTIALIDGPPSSTPPGSSPPIQDVKLQHEERIFRAHERESADDHENPVAAADTLATVLHHSQSPSAIKASANEGGTISDLLRDYNHDEMHMTTVNDEHTRPETIAAADVELAAPTPTAPKWRPNFDTPIDRPQSAFAASSVYSRDPKSASSHYSTPVGIAQLPAFAPLEPPPAVTPAPESVQALRHAERKEIVSCSHSRSKATSDDRKQVQRPSSAVSTRRARVLHTVEPIDSARASLGNESKPASQTAHHGAPLDCDGLSLRPAASVKSETILQPPIQLVIPELPAVVPIRRSTPLAQVRMSNQNNRHRAPSSKASREAAQTVYGSSSLALENTVIEDILCPQPSPALPPRTSFQNAIKNFPQVSPLISSEPLNFKSASPVSPLLPPELNINKRDVETKWSYRKPVPKRPDSPASIAARASLSRELEMAHPRLDDQTTTDLRFSSLGMRPVLGQLENPREQPGLESVTGDLRVSSTFKFPLPQRRSSLAHFEEFRLSRNPRRKESADLNKDSVCRLRASTAVLSKNSPLHAASGISGLRDIRSIPSFQFSHVNLFAKLNEALDVQREISGLDLPEVSDKQERLESTGNMRQKYRSFFECLDEMGSDPIVFQESSDYPCAPGQIQDGAVKQIVLPKIKQWTKEDLMAELDRLSIPSINGLTQRLSEMLPSLRRYYGDPGESMDDDDETVRSALDEIRRLGRELIPGLGGSETSFDGYSGSLGDKNTDTSDSVANSESSATLEVKLRPRSVSSPGYALVTSVAELDASSPVMLRSRSLSDGGRVLVRESNAEKRGSIVGSPPESRPWNLDASYPWANSVPSVDISLPVAALRRDLQRQRRPSRLRDDITETATANELTNAVSTVVDNTDITSRSHTRGRRRNSKRSILGSLSRRLGLPRTSPIDNSGYATALDVLGVKDRTVDPGDRYPTTGLSPPVAYNLDEVRSFFSDDSSHHERELTSTRTNGLRKRFSNLKTKLPPMSRTHSALDQRIVPPRPNLRRSSSLLFAQDMIQSINIPGFESRCDEAFGMPKSEFRARKLVNRMKNIWYKGGNLLRSLSGKRRPRDGQDWEEDGESIVWIRA